MPRRVRSGTIVTGRGKFAVLEAQPGHGVCERRPALLVPGYTGSKEDFLPVLEPLAAAGRTVVAMDLRGQYQSPHAPSRAGYAPGELAADVLSVAAAIAEPGSGTAGDPGVHLVGHSMGGLIARHAALSRAGRLLSLALLGSGPGAIGGQRAAALRDLLQLLDPPPGDGQLASDSPISNPGDSDVRISQPAGRLQEIVAQIWRERLEPQARSEGTDEKIIAFLRERTHRTCPQGLIVMARYLLSCPDRTEELAVLTRPASRGQAAELPVLVMYGENDDAWPPAVQDKMARRLHAERACIPGAAHSPAVEAPETTARALTTFWNAADWRRPAAPPPSQS
jgi:pimeloyl-ACP methyl ester carboxylesterase